MNTYRQNSHTLFQQLRLMLLTMLACLVLAPVAEAQSFSVPGTAGRNWVDTGLDVPPGTLIRLAASGQVDVGFGWGRYSPEGTTRFADATGYPAETPYRYGLVARLTDSGSNPHDYLRDQWSYGEFREFCAGRGGHLWLTVNDDSPADNSGEFTVEVTRGACRPYPTVTAPPIFVYTARARSYMRSRRFRVGEKVVVRVENNSPYPIYYVSIPRGAELIRGEDIIVQRLDGGAWVNAPGSVSIDEPPHRCIELRGGWNATREWSYRWASPGTYRIALRYNTRAIECSYGAPSPRHIAYMVYSETFEVAG
jgi:hypothetical protein